VPAVDELANELGLDERVRPKTIACPDAVLQKRRDGGLEDRIVRAVGAVVELAIGALTVGASKALLCLSEIQIGGALVAHSIMIAPGELAGVGDPAPA
jgi:hypothetical protein